LMGEAQRGAKKKSRKDIRDHDIDGSSEVRCVFGRLLVVIGGEGG